MNTGKIALIALSGIFALLVMGFIYYTNKFESLLADYNEQVTNSGTEHDGMWKILKQQAGVTEQYSKDFADNYERIFKARNYGGELMKWITESNPEFTPDMHKKLMNSIEVYRLRFNNEQKKVRSYYKEMDKLLRMFPSKLFLSLAGYELPELKIVTSTYTEKAFETGKDDDIQLFEKKEEKEEDEE